MADCEEMREAGMREGRSGYVSETYAAEGAAHTATKTYQMDRWGREHSATPRCAVAPSHSVLAQT